MRDPIGRLGVDGASCRETSLVWGGGGPELTLDCGPHLASHCFLKKQNKTNKQNQVSSQQDHVSRKSEWLILLLPAPRGSGATRSLCGEGKLAALSAAVSRDHYCWAGHLIKAPVVLPEEGPLGRYPPGPLGDWGGMGSWQHQLPHRKNPERAGLVIWSFPPKFLNDPPGHRCAHRGGRFSQAP